MKNDITKFKLTPYSPNYLSGAKVRRFYDMRKYFHKKITFS